MPSASQARSGRTSSHTRPRTAVASTSPSTLFAACARHQSVGQSVSQSVSRQSVRGAPNASKERSVIKRIAPPTSGCGVPRSRWTAARTFVPL